MDTVGDFLQIFAYPQLSSMLVGDSGLN